MGEIRQVQPMKREKGRIADISAKKKKVPLRRGRGETQKKERSHREKIPSWTEIYAESNRHPFVGGGGKKKTKLTKSEAGSIKKNKRKKKRS